MAERKFVSEADLEPDSMKVVNLNGKPILLVNVDGAYYAISNLCSHMNCPLSRGILMDGKIQCPCHGAAFDVKTGEVTRGPANKPQQKYEVTVEDGKVFIKK